MTERVPAARRLAKIYIYTYIHESIDKQIELIMFLDEVK